MKFAFWFLPILTRIRTEDLCPSARKIRSTRVEDLRRSKQLSTGVRAKQPRNSSEKVQFFVLCTVHLLETRLNVLIILHLHSVHGCGSELEDVHLVS